MNMLSTPTASTRNGMTSTIIRVDFMFKKLKRPIEAVTDSKTIPTPHKPNTILELIRRVLNDLYCPNVIDI